MEFRFNVNPLFPQKTIRVDSNLAPLGFTGDKRQLIDTTTKMTEIINALGEASARAQGLAKPVTSAQKLRNSDQSVYLLAEETGKNGCVVGMLKVGTKSLYVFDPHGDTKQVRAPCVLDFYVHESRQRSGLGKQLFESMLADQHYAPVKMAIDRPSAKLIGFLDKHYNLKRTIPQMNNFVVYDGFFETATKPTPDEIARAAERQVNITNSPNTSLFGPHVMTSPQQQQQQQQQQHGRQNSSQSSPMSALGQMPGFQTSPMGRFGAPRPLCSMSEIIHNSPKQKSTEPNSHHHQPASVVRPSRRPLHPLMAAAGAEHEARVRCRRQHYPQPANFRLGIDDGDVDDPRHHGQHSQHSNGDRRPSTEPWLPEAALAAEAQRNHFQLTKQHTGMKNMSYNVTAAVTAACDGPVDGADAVGRGTVQWTPPKSFVDAKPAHMKAAANGAGIPAYRPVANQLCESSQIAAATKRLQQEQQQQQHVAADVVQPDGITEQGYFDLKFYHNKLW